MMKTILVDFAKRDERNRILLSHEQLQSLRPKETVRITDGDIAVAGTVIVQKRKSYVLINWHTVEYKC